MNKPRTTLRVLQVGPHPYQRLRRFFNRGRCRQCYLHKRAHPTQTWTVSRQVGDKRPPFASSLPTETAPEPAPARAISRWRRRRGGPLVAVISKAEAKRIAYPARERRSSRKHGRR